MKKTVDYIHNIQNLVAQLLDTQLENIERAGNILASTIMNNGFVYMFGTGHSHMMAEELFYRAGGLARIYPILEEGLMLHNGAEKSTELERLEGYAERIIGNYPCNAGDCIIIASNSGRNAVNIEMAQAAQVRGMKVIALTNLTHSKQMESRHHSGLKLYQVADVVLDNLGCLGDASVYFDEVDRKVGATSTSMGALILHAVAISAIEQMLAAGYQPEIFSSSNLDEGDAINSKIISDYKTLIKPL